MADPKNVSWRLAALGLLVGALATLGVLALLDDAPAPSEEDPSAPAHEGAMSDDARCAHMPEHCAPPEDA